MATELNDANFFEFVHGLQNGESESVAERRVRARFPFTEMQRIAPFVEGRFPKEEEFQPIRCEDLSSEGFSFFMSSPPEYREWIVSLAKAKQSILLRAEVVSCEEVPEKESPSYRIGCRFLERLESPDSTRLT